MAEQAEPLTEGELVLFSTLTSMLPSTRNAEQRAEHDRLVIKWRAHQHFLNEQAIAVEEEKKREFFAMLTPAELKDSFLSASAYESYVQVVGSLGGVYRIHFHGYSGNVEVLARDSLKRLVHAQNVCAHIARANSRDMVDTWIAQYLLIKTDEQKFRDIALYYS